MPIYEYRCDSCGFQKEYIQRMSDAPLTDCPECKKATFTKMVTAAGFQLKGGGWYVTDFKGGNKSTTSESKKTEKNQTDRSGGDSGSSESKAAASKSESSSPATPSSASTSSPSSSAS